MSNISYSRYVDITSGVGGGAAVRERELIGRIMTTNVLLPTGTILEFESATAVANYFGSSSEEYTRAAFYFGWVSKNTVSPQKLSFGRWADADTAPLIYGVVADYELATFTAITAGSLILTLGADTNTITGINLSTATSLADVASLIQTAIRTQTGTMWTAATVAYNATRKSFDLVGGDTGSAVIAVSDSTLMEALGWTDEAILSRGYDIQTVTEVLIETEEVSNNFASFAFIPEMTDAEILEAATWNDTNNNMYMYCVPATTSTKASDYYSALSGLSGVAVTLSSVANEYHEMVPMIILAATNYAKRNSTQNYMFQFFDLTPTVTTDSVADTLDALRCNYYGQTKTAGQNIEFYQRGTMMGLATDAVDQNTYANEIWLKDAAAAAVMTLLLALAKVSANTQGKSQLLAILQSVVNRALFNGTISVGKELSTTQKLYIANQTGDETAWYQVQNIGYWLDVVFESYVTIDDRTEYKAVYTLIYSKDDVIRKVDGTHTLI